MECKPALNTWGFFSLGRKNRHRKCCIHSLPLRCFIFPSLHSLLGSSGKAGWGGVLAFLARGEEKQISWNGQLLLLAVMMPGSLNLFDGLLWASAHLHLHVKDYFIPLHFQSDTSPQFCEDEVIGVCWGGWRLSCLGGVALSSHCKELRKIMA